MELAKRIEAGESVAEILGMPPEVTELVASVAAAALDSGRVAEAEKVLEGLVGIHPRDPRHWALLARAHVRTGKPLAARFAVAVARQLAPAEPAVRLAEAEVQLCAPEGRAGALGTLRALAAEPGEVGARAGTLLAALGEGTT